MKRVRIDDILEEVVGENRRPFRKHCSNSLHRDENVKTRFDADVNSPKSGVVQESLLHFLAIIDASVSPMAEQNILYEKLIKLIKTKETQPNNVVLSMRLCCGSIPPSFVPSLFEVIPNLMSNHPDQLVRTEALITLNNFLRNRMIKPELIHLERFQRLNLVRSWDHGVRLNSYEIFCFLFVYSFEQKKNPQIISQLLMICLKGTVDRDYRVRHSILKEILRFPLQIYQQLSFQRNQTTQPLTHAEEVTFVSCLVELIRDSSYECRSLVLKILTKYANIKKDSVISHFVFLILCDQIGDISPYVKTTACELISSIVNIPEHLYLEMFSSSIINSFSSLYDNFCVNENPLYIIISKIISSSNSTSTSPRTNHTNNMNNNNNNNNNVVISTRKPNRGVFLLALDDEHEKVRISALNSISILSSRSKKFFRISLRHVLELFSDSSRLVRQSSLDSIMNMISIKRKMSRKTIKDEDEDEEEEEEEEEEDGEDDDDDDTQQERQQNTNRNEKEEVVNEFSLDEEEIYVLLTLMEENDLEIRKSVRKVISELYFSDNKCLYAASVALLSSIQKKSSSSFSTTINVDPNIPNHHHHQHLKDDENAKRKEEEEEEIYNCLKNLGRRHAFRVSSIIYKLLQFPQDNFGIKVDFDFTDLGGGGMGNNDRKSGVSVPQKFLTDKVYVGVLILLFNSIGRNPNLVSHVPNVILVDHYQFMITNYSKFLPEQLLVIGIFNKKFHPTTQSNEVSDEHQNLHKMSDENENEEEEEEDEEDDDDDDDQFFLPFDVANNTNQQQPQQQPALEEGKIFEMNFNEVRSLFFKTLISSSSSTRTTTTTTTTTDDDDDDDEAFRMMNKFIHEITQFLVFKKTTETKFKFLEELAITDPVIHKFDYLLCWSQFISCFMDFFFTIFSPKTKIFGLLESLLNNNINNNNNNMSMTQINDDDDDDEVEEKIEVLVSKIHELETLYVIVFDETQYDGEEEGVEIQQHEIAVKFELLTINYFVNLIILLMKLDQQQQEEEEEEEEEEQQQQQQQQQDNNNTLSSSMFHQYNLNHERAQQQRNLETIKKRILEYVTKSFPPLEKYYQTLILNHPFFSSNQQHQQQEQEKNREIIRNQFGKRMVFLRDLNVFLTSSTSSSSSSPTTTTTTTTTTPEEMFSSRFVFFPNFEILFYTKVSHIFKIFGSLDLCLSPSSSSEFGGNNSNNMVVNYINSVPSFSFSMASPIRVSFKLRVWNIQDHMVDDLRIFVVIHNDNNNNNNEDENHHPFSTTRTTRRRTRTRKNNNNNNVLKDEMLFRVFGVKRYTNLVMGTQTIEISLENFFLLTNYQNFFNKKKNRKGLNQSTQQQQRRRRENECHEASICIVLKRRSCGGHLHRFFTSKLSSSSSSRQKCTDEDDDDDDDDDDEEEEEEEERVGEVLKDFVVVSNFVRIKLIPMTKNLT